MNVPLASRTPSRRTGVPLWLMLTLALTACDARPEGAAERSITPKVLLIGIDGVRSDVLAAVSTPNLDALASTGTFTAQTRTTSPSVSGPAWSSMLTGVWPEKHGVTNNEFTGKRYGEYPDFLTRIEQVRPELSTFAVADWLPLVAAEDGNPTISDRVDERHVLDGSQLGWPEADGRSVEIAVRHLLEADPDAMFVYLGNPDETSHEHRSIGPEYREAIALADRHVGMLVEALRARPGYADEDWLIIASTDHGRREDGGHGGDSEEEMTTFLLLNGRSDARGVSPGATFIVDVPVTALAHLGIALAPEWGLDGRPLGTR